MSQFFSAGLFGSAIPDSAVAHYDAQSAFDSSDDGNTISTWPDELGNYDLSGGSPTVQSDALNGYRAPVFDGVDDLLDNTNPLISQRTTIFVVTTNDAGADGNYHGLTDSTNGSNRISVFWNNSNNWRMGAGNGLVGSSDASIQLITAVFDGSTSLLREEGTQTESGDVGNGELDGIRVGEDAGNGNYWEGPIGEVVICDGRVSSSDIQDEEQRLADKWGITL